MFNGYTCPRVLEREGIEAGFEWVCEYLDSQRCARSQTGCAPYHSLERLVALVVCRFTLLRALLSLWRHVEVSGALACGLLSVAAQCSVPEACTWWGTSLRTCAKSSQQTHHHALTHKPQAAHNHARPNARDSFASRIGFSGVGSAGSPQHRGAGVSLCARARLLPWAIEVQTSRNNMSWEMLIATTVLS